MTDEYVDTLQKFQIEDSKRSDRRAMFPKWPRYYSAFIDYFQRCKRRPAVSGRRYHLGRRTYRKTGKSLIVTLERGRRHIDALLFARDFNDFPTVARKALRVIRYDGPSPISPSRSKTFFSGYAKLDQALEYVEALLPEQEVIQGVRRVTLRMFSHMALRELMANMLIHQVFLLPVPDL